MKAVIIWTLIPLLLLLSLVGLLFIAIDPKAWPKENTEMSSTDMRLIQPMSTVWCESLDLRSEHSFLLYHLTNQPTVKPFPLTRHTLDFSVSLHWRQKRQLKYFLLEGSVAIVKACASTPGGFISVVRDDGDVTNCLHSQEVVKSGGDDSDESEESDEDSSEDGLLRHPLWDSRIAETQTAQSSVNYRSCPSSLIEDQPIPVLDQELMLSGCTTSSLVRSFRINVTSSSTYAILLENHHRYEINHLSIHLILDRATYSVHQNDNDNHVCAAFTDCTVPLTFASSEKVLVWFPAEPDAGQTTFVIHSRCRLRHPFFTVIFIVIPVALFVSTMFIVRSWKSRKRTDSAAGETCYDDNGRDTCGEIPLLEENPRHLDRFFVANASFQSTSQFLTSRNVLYTESANNANESSGRSQLENNTKANHLLSRTDQELPTYDSLYGPPPPYNAVQSPDREMQFD